MLVWDWGAFEPEVVELVVVEVEVGVTEGLIDGFPFSSRSQGHIDQPINPECTYLNGKHKSSSGYTLTVLHGEDDLGLRSDIAIPVLGCSGPIICPVTGLELCVRAGNANR